jgi:chitin disaccharide deacetylase
MNCESLLARLGYSPGDRVVVLHADDIGMCAASVDAYRELITHGILSSASVMVPCGWFPAVAEVYRDAVTPPDIGVHLTLTSEWANYRWGPLTGTSAEGLCDAAGYFHALAADVHERAREPSLYAELRAQMERARQAGIDITHVDTHMLALWHPAVIGSYARISREYGVPWFVAQNSPEEALERLGRGDRADMLVFDAWGELPLNESKNRLDTAKHRLDALPVGLSYFLSHPAKDSPELRAIAPDWEARVADYELYSSDAWARAIESLGVKVVGMRAIRDASSALRTARGVRQRALQVSAEER